MSFVIVGGIIAVGGAALGAHSANKAKKEAEQKEAAARAEMEALKETYASLDTSNPYANMENVMEDLTINQRQADFQAQQFQQSQANILSGMGSAAGSSGIASVAQALAQQGQLASQQAAASIGQQEQANQAAERKMAADIQAKERSGEVWSRNAERDKQATLLGMAQQETAAFGEQAAAAQEAKMGAISSGVSGVTSMLSDRRLKKNIKLIGKSPSNIKTYEFESIDGDNGKGVYQGVMSDEVPKEAVVKRANGYDMVDYSRIDVEFKKIR
jgi:hypothetical protein